MDEMKLAELLAGFVEDRRTTVIIDGVEVPGTRLDPLTDDEMSIVEEVLGGFEAK